MSSVLITYNDTLNRRLSRTGESLDLASMRRVGFLGIRNQKPGRYVPLVYLSPLSDLLGRHMIGQTIFHYHILEKLGEGGMGIVYKAEDLKLTRTVALKFLPHALHTNEPERARFLQEARAAAILNHPNICTIHDIQEYDGQQFIVMEYVEGTTLKEKIEHGGSKIEDGMSYAIQIGEALQEAHSKGIVHRDVKAENIMVNTRNQVKVMDFGLAKLKGSLKLTQTSSTAGTLAYMAPEQLRGEESDARSDIFSFGVMLSEMLTGRMPFKGEHEAAVMYSIVNEPPESLLKYRPDLPPELEHVVNRALEKDPEDRYQHVGEMVSELRRINKQSARVSRSSLPTIPDAASRPAPAQPGKRAARTSATKPWRPAVLIGAVCVAVLAIAAATYLFFVHSGQTSIDSLAVLPFVNASSDSSTEYLSDGMTESIINELSQLPGLVVMSRSSVFHYKGKDPDPREAGRQLGVKAVLTGRVMQQGRDLVISAELVNVANNSHIWGGRYNRKLADLVSVQDELSREISKNLGARLGMEESRQLSRGRTESSEAYQEYLKGKFHWNKRRADDLRKAVDYFTQAIEIDPNYALAYAGLASTYVIMPQYAGAQMAEVIPKVKAAAQKAIELDPTLAEPRAVLGLAKQIEWDWEEGAKEFKRAIELNPNYPTAHQWYSICLRQQGKIEQSLDEIRRAQELDPLSPVIIQNVAEIYMALHRYDEAFEQARKMLELDPNFIGAHLDLGYLYAREGRFEDAIREFEKVRQIVGPDHPYGLGVLGYAYAKAGKKDHATKILDQLLAFSRRGFVASSEAAMVYTGLGEKDKAFEWLDRALQEHDQPLGFIKTANIWESLRTDPRYAALVKKMGLNP